MKILHFLHKQLSFLNLRIADLAQKYYEFDSLCRLAERIGIDYLKSPNHIFFRVIDKLNKATCRIDDRAGLSFIIQIQKKIAGKSHNELAVSAVDEYYS